MSSKKISKNKKIILEILTGSLCGLSNGLFGGGGGMLVVPMLTKLLGKPSKVSHATALVVILPISILSGLLYSSFVFVDLKILIPVVIGVTIGGIIGSILLKRLSSKLVIILFSIVMLSAGIKMLFF